MVWLQTFQFLRKWSNTELKLTNPSHKDQYPELGPLFGDIALYILNLKPPNKQYDSGNPSKKRKLENGHNGTVQTTRDWDTASYSTIKELSFTIPQRKKLNLEIGDASVGLRCQNSTTKEVEFTIRWADIQYVACLPVPEKAQPQYNVCVFPTNGDGITTASVGPSLPEQLLWTIPNRAPKPGVCGEDIRFAPEESLKSVMVKLLNDRLKQRKGSKCQVIEPDEKEFVSEVAQPSKTGQKAVHVKAFRGSKDGFLFFLPAGIVWGFKKPLVFFSFDAIDSISYTSVLQRTFNLNISARGNGSSDEPQEFEFSMVDQADFAGIDAYIKRHRLQDASMAEQRRAKKYNVNGVKSEADQDEGENEPGELHKAALEADNAAQDDDDDEEDDVNFDPGSEGESEGSGTSDEEEEGNDAAADVNDGHDEEL